MNKLDILSHFHKQIIKFFDELIEQFPNEGDLVVARIFFTNKISPLDIMNIFIQKINSNEQQLRKMVKERNQEFFLKHNIFDALDKNKVNHFKKLWCSENIDTEDKNVIWSWIDLFIQLSDKYSTAES